MKVGILFPGYTSQFVGMGKEFYDQSRLMQEYFEEASNCLTINFVKLCFASSDSELSKGLHTNTALFLVGASISKIIQERGIQADLVAGSGIGQFTALFAAGGINVPDGLYLIAKYSNFFEEIQQAGEYKLLAVHGISLKAIQQVCLNVDAVITSYMSQQDYVIRVREAKVTDCTQELKSLKAKVQKIAPDFGFYSDDLESISSQLKMYLEKVDCNNLAIPVLNTQSAKMITTAKHVQQLITNFAHSPIKWHQSLKKLSDCDIIVDIAPTGNFKQQIQALYPDKIVQVINKPEDIDQLSALLNTSKQQDEQLTIATDPSI